MKCCCEDEGTIRSGIRGILAGPPDAAGRRVMERCDTCERFDSDEAAAIYFATKRGGAVRYSGNGIRLRVLWLPR